MEIIERLNAAMEYIEANLCDEVDFDAAARLACVAPDSFQRFFSYMTGMTLAEYVRRRRLTLVAEELRRGARVVDAAVRYGYDSASAFSRAFARQHGIKPGEYLRYGGALRVFPRAVFRIKILGASEMDFRLVEMEEKKVCGLSRAFEGQGYRSREELRHVMWSEDLDDIPGKLCEGRWNQPGSDAYDGVWYGVWQDGAYMIARERGLVKSGGLETRTLPAGTYAAFRTEKGGLAWVEFPRLFEEIFDAWLPASGYRQAGDTIVEVLHLMTDRELRKQERYYEVLIPVEPM